MYLAKRVADVWIRVIDYSECRNGFTQCYMVRDNGAEINQLSNSWVEFNSLYFYVTNSPIKTVTITFEMQPSTKKGIKPDLIKNHKIFFQTTLSEKLYNKNKQCSFFEQLARMYN